MTVVIDASVAFKWFLPSESQAAQAYAIVRGGETLIAPDLIIAETCNAAWRAARLSQIAPGEPDEIAATLPRFFAEFVSAAHLARRAAAIAARLDHPVYDCFYVALAEMRGTSLVTADTRLLAKLAGTAWAAGALRLADYPVDA